MHLLGEDQGAQVDTEGPRGPFPVGDDSVRHIAHVESQVQRCIRARRHPAVPGGHGNRRAQFGGLGPLVQRHLASGAHGASR